MVLKKFNHFFKIRKNIIYECARFNHRNQLQGETAEQYIMALYALADNCEYGTMKEELIRDRLVVGILDDALSKKLQLMSDLTLEKAKKEVRQNEAVQEQQQTLKNVGEPGTTDSSLEASTVSQLKHSNKRQLSSGKQTQLPINRGKPKGQDMHTLWKGTTPQREMSS